jgi:hypothetical protein
MKVALLAPVALCLVYHSLYTEATVATTLVVGGTTILALTAAQVTNDVAMPPLYRNIVLYLCHKDHH